MEDNYYKYKGFTVEISPNTSGDVQCLAYCDEDCCAEFEMFTLNNILESSNAEARSLSESEYLAVTKGIESYIDGEYEKWMNKIEINRQFYSVSAEINEQLEKRSEQSTKAKGNNRSKEYGDN